jgi:hypothetical protein
MLPCVARSIGALSIAVLLTCGSAEGAAKTGLTVGISYASLGDIRVGDAETSYEKRTGSHFGFFVQSALGPLGLRTGAIYLNAGPLFEGLSDDLEGNALFDDSFDLRFFVIPLDLQYRIPTPAISPYLLLGPELRFNTTSAGDFEDNFKSVVWGGNLGVGAEIAVPFLNLTLAPEVRYAFDLTDLTEDTLEIGGESYPIGESYRTGMFHLRIHIGF